MEVHAVFNHDVVGHPNRQAKAADCLDLGDSVGNDQIARETELHRVGVADWHFLQGRAVDDWHRRERKAVEPRVATPSVASPSAEEVATSAERADRTRVGVELDKVHVRRDFRRVDLAGARRRTGGNEDRFHEDIVDQRVFNEDEALSKVEAFVDTMEHYRGERKNAGFSW